MPLKNININLHPLVINHFEEFGNKKSTRVRKRFTTTIFKMTVNNFLKLYLKYHNGGGCFISHFKLLYHPFTFLRSISFEFV